jgi:hypothetical protein
MFITILHGRNYFYKSIIFLTSDKILLIKVSLINDHLQMFLRRFEISYYTKLKDEFLHF